MKENFFNNLALAFAKAWELFFDVPLPLSDDTREALGDAEADDALVLCCAPLIGFVPGFAAYVLASGASALAGAYVAAALCAFVVVILWEVLTRGKDTTTLIALINGKLFHRSGDGQGGADMATYIFIALFGFKVACVGLLVYFNHVGWLMAVAVLTFSFQGALALGKSAEGDPFLVSDTRGEVVMWGLAAFLCVVFGGLTAGLVAVALTALAAVKLRDLFDRMGGVSGSFIGAMGKAVELGLLILGPLLLIRK